MTELLLCGGTGQLGGAIAAGLAGRGVPFRALVRAGSDPGGLRALGAEICTGDLTDRASLERALTGTTVVVTTANAIGRLFAGARDLSIEGVDRVGNENLVRAAEAAGVQRFVFVSAAGLTDLMVARAPFAAAKRHVEALLLASAMPSVIVRPSQFQELWLAPETGIDPAKRRAVVFGRGRAPTSDVAVADVAAACVRLATMDSPPAEIGLGGPEALTRHQVVDAFERAYGTRFRRIPVPRAVLTAGARVLRRRKPEVASVLGMALARDVEGCDVGADALRELGVEPTATSDRIAAMAGGAALR